VHDLEQLQTRVGQSAEVATALCLGEDWRAIFELPLFITWSEPFKRHRLSSMEERVSEPRRTEIKWSKSPASGESGCVEVAFVNDAVLLRQSKDPAGPILTFTRLEWTAFLSGARDGAFDLHR